MLKDFVHVFESEIYKAAIFETGSGRRRDYCNCKHIIIVNVLNLSLYDVIDYMNLRDRFEIYRDARLC